MKKNIIISFIVLLFVGYAQNHADAPGSIIYSATLSDNNTTMTPGH